MPSIFDLRVSVYLHVFESSLSASQEQLSWTHCRLGYHRPTYAQLLLVLTYCLYMCIFVYLHVFVLSFRTNYLEHIAAWGITDLHLPSYCVYLPSWPLQLSQGCYLMLSFVTPGYHSDTIIPTQTHLTITSHNSHCTSYAHLLQQNTSDWSLLKRHTQVDFELSEIHKTVRTYNTK